MSTPSPLALASSWNLVSSAYAEKAPAIMAPFSERAVQLAAPPRDARALDVACGSGVTTFALAEKVARVDAVDFSEGMLAQLRVALAERDTKHATLHAADGQHLPFPDATFDVALSMFGLMFFPDRARGLGEMLRVLRPGGVMVIGSWVPMEQSSLMALTMEAVRAVNPEPMPSPPPPLPLSSPAEAEAEVIAAGFTAVSVTLHTHSMVVENAEQFWQAAMESNVFVALLRQRLGETVWQERQGRGLAVVREHLAGGPIRLSASALLTRGERPR